MVCGNLHTDGPHRGVTAALQRDTLLHKFTKYTLHAIPCSPVYPVCHYTVSMSVYLLSSRAAEQVQTYLEALFKVVYAGTHKCSGALLLR